MREVLFRGKRIDNGEWIYGFYELCGTMINSPFESTWSAIRKFGEEESTEVIADSVGQFTGLLDKNGKKIFEHDIVRGKLGFCGSPNIPIKEYIFEVKYSNGCFEEIYSSDYYEFEVLGNIFDDKFFLKL